MRAANLDLLQQFSGHVLLRLSRLLALLQDAIQDVRSIALLKQPRGGGVLEWAQPWFFFKVPAGSQN